MQWRRLCKHSNLGARRNLRQQQFQRGERCLVLGILGDGAAFGNARVGIVAFRSAMDRDPSSVGVRPQAAIDRRRRAVPHDYAETL
jgi:hypothetical protein